MAETLYVISGDSKDAIAELDRKMDRIIEVLNSVLAAAPAPADEEPWYTTEEICEILRTTPPTLRKLRGRGEVEVKWLGERSPRYRLARPRV